SGLYSYTLSIKEAGKETEKAREQRGHFIVDRAADRDNGADRLWVTSHRADVGAEGAELTVARDENAVVAGTTTSIERALGRSAEGRNRSDEGRSVEAQSGQLMAEAKNPTQALTNGTVGYIAKFTNATEFGNSVMKE